MYEYIVIRESRRKVPPTVPLTVANRTFTRAILLQECVFAQQGNESIVVSNEWYKKRIRYQRLFIQRKHFPLS